MADKIIIYGTSHCPWCHKAREFLTAHKVKFTDINVEENEKAKKDMIKKSGQLGVPVIDINGNIIVGFDESMIRKLLKLK
ncbi:MAG: glutaredoxin family protein [Candidatus Pacearchaeota archaeon]